MEPYECDTPLIAATRRGEQYIAAVHTDFRV